MREESRPQTLCAVKLQGLTLISLEKFQTSSPKIVYFETPPQA